MTQLSIMIAMLAALALGGAPQSNLFNNTDGGPLAARAVTQSGINPVQHSE